MDLEIMVNLFASAFLMALKKPELKSKIRKVALKVFTAIKLNYASDPEFHE